MIQYKFVEDYIEAIAGFKAHSSVIPTSVGNIIPHLGATPLINLARYDVKVIENLAIASAASGLGYTDRQGALAISLILKYERQLAKHQIDIAPIKEDPQYRLPIRVINRTSQVWVENDEIKIRFPYNPELIESVRKQSKDGQGSIQFQHNSRIWIASLTEANVNWIHTFATQNHFEIDPTFQLLMDQIVAVEQAGYTIQLRAGQDRLYIENAADSLNTYIEEHSGGFSLDNAIKLIDMAPILGYTIDPELEAAVIEVYGTRFFSLCNNRELKVDVKSNQETQVMNIIEYAKTAERFPIYVYEPDMSNILIGMFGQHIAPKHMVNLDLNQPITPDSQMVYTTRIPKLAIERIPLMVSAAGMIFGGDRQVWIQNAEKVVYFTREVYNKVKTDSTKGKGRSICELN